MKAQSDSLTAAMVVLSLGIILARCNAVPTEEKDASLDGTAPGALDCNGACSPEGGYCAEPTQGEAGCRCQPGWYGDGTFCINIDECEYGVGETVCAQQKQGKRL